jgi:predicted porin
LPFLNAGSARRGALIALLMTGSAGGVLAQTTAAAKPNCFATFWSWFDSSAAGCPLGAYGLTIYGTIDTGGGYETHGAPLNGDAKTGVAELISKVNNGSRWQGVPSGLSQSNFGVKFQSEVAPNWFLIGDLNAAFDPLSLKFANGPKSLVDNTNVPLAKQSTNADSGRSTGFDNSRGYVGISNPTFGTLTVGRQTSFSADVATQYDPSGGGYAFSAIGNSSTFVGGTGDTELSHYNRSIRYQLAYKGLRVGAITQIGGYEQSNNAKNAYQFDLGGDAGHLSVDAIYSYAKDAVSVSNYASGAPTPETLKATLANVSAGVFAAKYKWRALTVFAGYEYARLSTPSDLFGATATKNGGTLTLNGGYPAVVQANPYVNPKDQQIFWVGGKYKLLPSLDVDAGYYYIEQNNYTNAATKYNTGGSASKAAVGCGPNLNPAIPGSAPQGANAAACAGNENVLSAVLDWRLTRRFDLYSGVMYSKVAGGLANGFIVDNNTAFTTGARLNF